MPFRYDAFIQRFVTSLLDISKSRASRKLLEKARRNPFYIWPKSMDLIFLNSIIEWQQQTKKIIYTVESNLLSKLTIELAFFL
jgi:hypothetical protein